MNHKYYKHKKILVIFMLLFQVAICNSQNQQSALLIDKQSREHGLNLKDSVKSVRFFYTYFKKELPTDEWSLLYLRNDIRTSFYYEFNKIGKITATLLFLKDSINEPIKPNKLDIYTYAEDYKIKNSFKIKHRNLFPAYYDNLIKLNSNEFSGNSDRVMRQIYSYRLKDDKIDKVNEYVFFTYKNDSLNYKLQESDLSQIKIYKYDKNENLISQQFLPGNNEEPGALNIMDTETSYCDDTRIDYTYDIKNRLIKVVLTSCSEVVESEEYAYHPTEGYITTLKRFILNATYSSYPTNNMVAQYNEYGDIVEMHMIVKNDTNPPKTKVKLEPVHRYYEYEYDKHNNWIKCKLYLMGTKEEPTAIAERIIEYYNK